MLDVMNVQTGIMSLMVSVINFLLVANQILLILLHNYVHTAKMDFYRVKVNVFR